MERWNLKMLVGVPSVLGALLACAPVTSSDVGERAAVPVRVGSGTFTQVAAGFVHTCALDERGTAFCWGNNDYSQLGADVADRSCGGRPCSKQPVAVSGGHQFTALAAGWVHNCGIATDTGTYCWGGGVGDRGGYLGDGAVRESAVPVRVQSDSTFVAVAIGDGHTCALTASGMAFCWGANGSGQLGDGTVADRAVPTAVATALRFATLVAGASHSCGISRDGSAHCWGDNRWGQLGTGDVPYNATSASQRAPSPVSGDLRFTELAAGWQHTCGIATTGTTFCWGRNDDARQLGDASEVTHRGIPGPISDATLRFSAIAAGALATCGTTATRETHCWGANYYGGLGNGTTTPAGVGRPVRTLGGPFAEVGIGQAHACAIATDRRLWCWGDQSAGQF